MLIRGGLDDDRVAKIRWGSMMAERVFRFRHGEWAFGGRPYIFGILNITPDSFSDGTPDYTSPDRQVERAQLLLDDGADGLDIGAESTRPGYQPVSLDAEWERLVEPLLRIRRAFPEVPISVDTAKPLVAERALSLGVNVINDIWGLSASSDLARLAAEAGAGYIGMFNTHDDPRDPVDVGDIREWLERMVDRAEAVGLGRESILVDPGLGFRVQGYEIWRVMTQLQSLEGLGAGILVGHSRKRFLGAATGVAHPRDRDVSTAVLSGFLALAGADVLRVHHPGYTRQALLLAEHWRRAGGHGQN